MYQWRKFEFFEEKQPPQVSSSSLNSSPAPSAIPPDISGRIRCCSSGRGRVSVGCDNGTVGLLDRGFKLSFGFQAHASSVLFIQQLKQRNILVSVGDDDQVTSQSSSICLKVFDLDKVQAESTSSTSPFCVQILRIFTQNYPEAKITSFLVLEEAPPILLIAIGLDNGSIYCIKGDIARERISRFKLQVEATSDSVDLSIVGLAFRVEGKMLQLFAVTHSSVSLFTLHDQPPRRILLDQIGSEVNAIAMSDRQDLIIGRPEAVYFYGAEGRGPCWAFDGNKKFIGWFRGYLLSVVEDQKNGKNTFNIYDLKNRLIAHSMVIGDVSHLVCEWGYVILIMSDKRILCIGEKDMESKLDMLFKKNLYSVAINLVQSQQADAAATAEVLRKYADHLYGKQEYDEAMTQYIHTIGHLEPSYVIQKFLDAQRIYNLTNYLEKLHDRGLASKEHTTLLLNCYTKLKDVEKLNKFIRDEDSVGELKFDVETAIKACRSAGYHEHAMFVARKAGRHELYLKSLLEDLSRYDEALQYISNLEANQAGFTVKEYGKILVEHRPAQTVALLLKLCTNNNDMEGISSGMQILMLPSPMDFVNIFVHNQIYLMEFLEKYISRVKDSPAREDIHNTLLELYISNDLSIPSLSQENGFEDYSTTTNSSQVANGGHKEDAKQNVIRKDGNVKDRVARQQKALALLKSAWTSDMEEALYDDDRILILCELNGFKEGVLFLYEKRKEYSQMIACYKEARDHKGLIECCKKLVDTSQSADPSLWTDVLKYFGELGEDCSKEVKEVLSYVEKDDILPPIIVVQMLSKNPCLTLSVVKDYIARKLEQESKLIEEDRKSIDKYQEETEAMRKEIEDLKTNAKIFQLSKCTACTFTLDLPAVHFMCMHSFHLRCLGDNEKECPECAPDHKSVFDAKRNLERNARDHSSFFQQLKSSKDGFAFIADFMSKGIISKTTVTPQ